MAVYESDGTTIAHAIDHDDMLNILINFLTGVVGTLPASQQWTLLKDDSTSVSGSRFVYFQGPGIPATGILTLTTNALNNETVTIDTKVYTFQTTLTNVDGNVLIGATASDSIDNLIAAINLAAGSGTTYAAATVVHPTVSASAGTGNTMNVFAKTSGSSGNSIATTETLTGGSWISTTLVGGLDSNVYVNIHRFSNEPTDARNWQFKYAINFDTAQDFNNQPGTHSQGVYYTMTDNVAMPFRIIANARRFIVITQSVLAFNACYLGFYLPYATPSEMPYPICVGGNSITSTNNSQVTNYTMGNFYDGMIGGLIVRHVDGTHISFGSYGNSTSGSRPTTSIAANNFPYDQTSSGANYLLLDNEESGGSNSWPLLSQILYTTSNNGNVYGELEGVFFVPNRNNFTNNIITIDSVDYLVLQNTYRSSEVNAAFRLT